MKELDTCLKDLVAAVRTAYRPTLAHDALIRAAIAELTSLDEPPPMPAKPASQLVVQPLPLAPRPVAPMVSAETERALRDILDAPVTDATIAAAFTRKEHELGALFHSLRPAEAGALRKRLEAARTGDELATQFARLAPDRRARLTAVLADARRREAIQYARGGAR